MIDLDEFDDEARARDGFTSWLTLRVVIWTLLPLAFLSSLPVDLIEGVIWGQGWQLGYDQPPLQAWILGALDWIFGYERWAILLCSQLLVAICIWSVWRLAGSIVRPLGALVSAAMLEGVWFFNFGSPNLFPDLISMPFWALAILSFHRALRTQSTFSWIVLGVCLAGAAYAKYISAVLAVAMIGFLIVEPQARRSWRSPGPYVCATITLLLLVPHLWWAVQNDFPTVSRIHVSAEATTGLVNHLLCLLGFAAGQVLVSAGALALSSWLARPAQEANSGSPPIELAGSVSEFDRRFIATMALGPIALMLLGALLGGVWFRVHWTYAMWSLTGLFVVVFVAPTIDRDVLHRLGRAWGVVALLPVLVYAGVNGFASRLQVPVADSRNARNPLEWAALELQQEARHSLARVHRESGHPGREIAEALTEQWRARVGGRLRYVIANKWVGANIAFFAPDHPLVLRDGDPTRSPWVDMDDVRKQGAVIAWNAAYDTNDIAAILQRRFPEMEPQPALALPAEAVENGPPVEIRWGILRPEGRNVLEATN